MDDKILPLIVANEAKVNLKRGAEGALGECARELRDACKYIKLRVKAIRDLQKTVPDHESEKVHVDVTCDAAVDALLVAGDALDLQAAAADRDKETMVTRIEADPDHVQAEFNARVLRHIIYALNMLGGSNPIAYLPGQLRAQTDLLDVINAARGQAASARAVTLAALLDPAIVKRFRSLKQKPCTITLRYATWGRKEEVTAEPQEFRLVAVTIPGVKCYGQCADVLGYSGCGKIPEPDAEHIEANRAQAKTVKDGDRPTYHDEFELVLDGQALYVK